MTKRINLILFFTIFTYLKQIQQTIALIIKQPQPGVLKPNIECCYYTNDNHIIDGFPFTVHLNPTTQSSAATFALMNKNGNIISLKIVNQKYVPSLIYCFKHLSKLEIVNTSFCDTEQRLPAEIEYLASSLTHLRIYNTTITHLPNQIGKLKRLKTLKLSNIGLKFLPDAIGYLPSLNILFLPNNNLTFLPITITTLRSLTQLTLSNNSYLRSIQSLDGQSTLKILDTRHCPIEVLPRNLPKLTDLYMSDNNLTKLSGIETLGNGTNSRKFFYFDQNHIQSISPQIRCVRNLYRLNLYQNELDNLPMDIFNITTLSYLNIQENPFHHQDLKTIVSMFHDTMPNLNISYN